MKQSQIILNSGNIALLINPIPGGSRVSIVSTLYPYPTEPYAEETHYDAMSVFGPAITQSEAESVMRCLQNGHSLEFALAEVVGAA